MLDTLNWNICGVNTKRATLLAYCKTENYDIIALQETLVQTGKKFRVNRYNTYTTPCENTNRGLAILVKSSIPVKRITNPISCGDCVEVMAVRLTLENQTLDIYNIYRNINHGELDLSQLFAHTENTNTLITGDFNAHHEVLCSPRPPNPAGDHIYQSLTDFNGVSLLNDGVNTYKRWKTRSILHLHNSQTILHLGNTHKTHRRSLQQEQRSISKHCHRCLHLHPGGIKAWRTGAHFKGNLRNGQGNMIHQMI